MSWTDFFLLYIAFLGGNSHVSYIGFMGNVTGFCPATLFYNQPSIWRNITLKQLRLTSPNHKCLVFLNKSCNNWSISSKQMTSHDITMNWRRLWWVVQMINQRNKLTEMISWLIESNCFNFVDLSIIGWFQAFFCKFNLFGLGQNISRGQFKIYILMTFFTILWYFID